MVAIDMNHVCAFRRLKSIDKLTTPQLRKLVFYTGADIGQCECGNIMLPEFEPPKIYSRNGSLVK